jgi:hypothetical protein
MCPVLSSRQLPRRLEMPRIAATPRGTSAQDAPLRQDAQPATCAFPERTPLIRPLGTERFRMCGQRPSATVKILAGFFDRGQIVAYIQPGRISIHLLPLGP